MGRSFVINGETLVMVKGNGELNLSGVPIGYSALGFGYGQLSELGLASENIIVTPKFYHKDVNVTDFGPNVPAETMFMLSEVNIQMTLIHYDRFVLDAALDESMAGSFDGIIAPAGTLMGGGRQLLMSGNHYISLNLLSPVLGDPWRFPASYLASNPITLPMGTETTKVVLNWKAIPYRAPDPGGGYVLPTSSSGYAGGLLGIGDVLSSGVPLWYRTLDVFGVDQNLPPIL